MKGPHPAAVAATTPKARRGRSALERLGVRLPVLGRAVVRLLFAVPRSRLRTSLLRYLYSRAYAAYNRRDWELNTLVHHENYVLRWGGSAIGRPAGARESYEGASGYLEFLALWHDSFEDYRLRYERHIEIDGAVLALIRQLARGAGSGLPLDMPAASLDRIENGRLVSQTFYVSRDEAIRELGLTPPSPPK